MSEPKRLRDEGPEAVRALLHAARRSRPMSPDERARARARLARTTAGLAAGAGLFAYLQGAAIGAALGLLTVGAAAVVPAWLAPAAPGGDGTTAPSPIHAAPVSPASVRPHDDPPRASVSAASSHDGGDPDTPPGPAGHGEDPQPPGPAGAPSAMPAPRPASPAGVADAPEPAASAAPAPVDSLAEEAALLERARTALSADPGGALALTAAHAARFPAGKLAVERELVAVDALRRLGRAGEARARGEALRARAGGSLYDERIRKLLDGLR